MTSAGECFEVDVRFDRQEISTFAKLCGDLNPLHHDPELAAESRFGGIIASGPHTSALMMGSTATHFAQRGEMVGLEFRFRFRRAVRADTTMTIQWQIVSVRHKPSLGGSIAFLIGKLVDPAGNEAVRSVGKVLLYDAA